MYAAGVFLLFCGLLLCISITWAAVGFVAMGFGLICLRVAGDRPTIELEGALVQPVHPDSSPGHLATLSNPGDEVGHEQRWRVLLESDPDLANVATILSRFGSRYVDQLARVYIVFDRKELLPGILEMIVSVARRDAEFSETAELSRQTGSFVDLPEAAIDAFPDVGPPSSLLTACTDDAAERGTTPFHEHTGAHGNHTSEIDEIPAAFPALDFDDQDNLKELFYKLASFEGDGGPFATLRERADRQGSIPKD
jgi:hypothetical protein